MPGAPAPHGKAAHAQSLMHNRIMLDVLTSASRRLPYVIDYGAVYFLDLRDLRASIDEAQMICYGRNSLSTKFSTVRTAQVAWQ
jgi:hypothetical protein